MKLFLDILICIVLVFLLLGVLDQIIKLTQDKLTRTNLLGATSPDMTYRQRLTIILVYTAVMIVLRLVVLRLVVLYQ